MQENNFIFQVFSNSKNYRMYLPDWAQDHIQRIISQSGRPYEEEMLEDMLKRSEPGDLILDIGANIGNHTVFLAVHGRKVMAFEPNNSLAESLRRSVELNGLVELVTVEEIAVGEQGGRGELRIPDSRNLGQGQIMIGSGEIVIASLDDIGIVSPIKAIKIDVEGMEYDVIKGALGIIGRDRPVIYVECSNVESLNILLEANFLKDYIYIQSFNRTATHLFLHRASLRDIRSTAEIDASSIFLSYEQTQRLLEKNSKLTSENSKLTSENSKLTSENSKLTSENSKVIAQKAELNRNFLGLLEAVQNELSRISNQPSGFLKISAKFWLLNQILHGSRWLSQRRAEKLRRSVDKRHPMANLFHTLSKAEAQVAKQSWDSVTPDKLDNIFYENNSSKKMIKRHSELVSIVIPAFNSERWIKNAVHSALSQSEVVVEVIIVDDGSSDNTVSIAMEIAKRNKNVRVVSLLRNFGCYYARNVGLMVSRGSYIATLDSDDIMSPDRISKQLDALKSHPSAMACLCRSRRWTEDFQEPLSELGFGENSLLWKRSLLETVGWYDSCRFGADTEFRSRILARHGHASVVRISDELYFLRSVDGSLALSKETSAYTMNSGSLIKELSPNRRVYADNFNSWHKIKPNDLKIDFPLLRRPFELGNEMQNASPSLGSRCVGAMASFPDRIDSLRKVLPPLLEQLDLLILYLNDYNVIPDFCVHPRIRVILGDDAQGDLRDNGKFYDLPQDDHSYVFTFDDDIIYPCDYVRRMVHFIESFDRSVIVGVHGVIFPTGSFDNLRQRTVHHFRFKKPGDFVDLLGTGTTAWHSSKLKPKLEDFHTKGQCDLWFSRIAAIAGLPMLSVPREEGWLQEVALRGKTLFKEALEQPSSYFDVYHEHIAPVLEEKQLRTAQIEKMSDQYPPSAIEAAMMVNWNTKSDG